MKIAYPTKHFNFRNGSSRAVHETAVRLVGRGHQVHIFCNRYPDEYSAGPAIHPVPMVRLGSWAKVISFDRACRGRLRRERFDIVHGQGNTLEQDILTVHICRKANRLARGLAVSPLDPHYYMERKQLSNPGLQAIIALSERVRRDIETHYGISGERIRVIPNGVDTRRFNPRTRLSFRARIRESWGIRPDELAVLFVASGNFKNRGLSNLLPAFRDLGNERLRLIVVGGDLSDEYRSSAQKLGLADRVRFLPFSRRIEEVYAGGDYLVFPSYYDTFGNVPLEAMASGLPVALTASCGVSEWVQDGRDAIVLKDPSDVTGLTEILSRLLDDELRARLGEAARSTAEGLSWDRISDQVFELYQQVLSDKAA